MSLFLISPDAELGTQEKNGTSIFGMEPDLFSLIVHFALEEKSNKHIVNCAQ